MVAPSGTNVIKKFPKFSNFCNKLDCMLLASCSSLVKSSKVRQRTPQSVASLRCSTVRLAPGLAHKHKTMVERLARVEHSSLLRTLVESFFNIGPDRAGENISDSFSFQLHQIRNISIRIPGLDYKTFLSYNFVHFTSFLV